MVACVRAIDDRRAATGRRIVHGGRADLALRGRALVGGSAGRNDRGLLFHRPGASPCDPAPCVGVLFTA